MPPPPYFRSYSFRAAQWDALGSFHPWSDALLRVLTHPGRGTAPVRETGSGPAAGTADPERAGHSAVEGPVRLAVLHEQRRRLEARAEAPLQPLDLLEERFRPHGVGPAEGAA